MFGILRVEVGVVVVCNLSFGGFVCELKCNSEFEDYCYFEIDWKG